MVKRAAGLLYSIDGLPERFPRRGLVMAKSVPLPTIQEPPAQIRGLPTTEELFMTKEEIVAQVHPRIREAVEAFDRELPNLLQDRSGNWVAYHGANRLGFSKDKTDLYQRFTGQGYDSKELFVTRVKAQSNVEFI
jgi:hypothetical protein